MTDHHIWLENKNKRMSSYDVLTSYSQTYTIYYPIDVFAIVEKLGIKVETVESPGYDGAITSSSNDAKIWIDSTKTLQRQRFTLAHLIGHLHLHSLCTTYYAIAVDSLYGMGDTRLKRDDGSVSMNDTAKARLGRQASDFGSALLMPRHIIQPMMYHTSLNIEQMATTFDVSTVGLCGRLNYIRSGREDR